VRLFDSLPPVRQVNAAVWPLLLVVMSPESDLISGIKQVLEPTHSQAFFAQLPMEALHMNIMRWLSVLNIYTSSNTLWMHQARK